MMSFEQILGLSAGLQLRLADVGKMGRGRAGQPAYHVRGSDAVAGDRAKTAVKSESNGGVSFR